jgi:hypothetical protein
MLYGFFSVTTKNLPKVVEFGQKIHRCLHTMSTATAEAVGHGVKAKAGKGGVR